MMLAPIVLFVYNRPYHTEQTLLRLSMNALADESVLYIYADGAKENASAEALKNIALTREVVRSKKWCKEVQVIESPVNRGLAGSIIKGVTEVMAKHGKAIILEDDIVTAKGFLKFMNEGLEMYSAAPNVAGISGWSFPIESKGGTYFSRVGACWGWATWARVWNKVDFDATALIARLEQEQRVHDYNLGGAYDYFAMLNKQAKGELDSWAVRFYTNYFLWGSLFLFPQKSLVQNTGFDGTGTNYTEGRGGKPAPVYFEQEFVDLSYLEPVEQLQTRRKIIASVKPPATEKPGLLRRMAAIIKRKTRD